MPERSLELEWADGVYTFALFLAQMGQIEARCGAPFGDVMSRTLKGLYADGSGLVVGSSVTDAAFGAKDIPAIIHQALVGGGQAIVDGETKRISPLDATRLVDTYVNDRPLKENWHLAGAILLALVEGFTPPKKEQPPEEAAEDDLLATPKP